MEHTKLPWEKGKHCHNVIMAKFKPDGHFRYKVAACFGEESEANAAFIVKACNAYPAMLEAITEMNGYLDGNTLELSNKQRPCNAIGTDSSFHATMKLLIAKAKGE